MFNISEQNLIIKLWDEEGKRIQKGVLFQSLGLQCVIRYIQAVHGAAVILRVPSTKRVSRIVPLYLNSSLKHLPSCFCCDLFRPLLSTHIWTIHTRFGSLWGNILVKRIIVQQMDNSLRQMNYFIQEISDILVGNKKFMNYTCIFKYLVSKTRYTKNQIQKSTYSVGGLLL